MYFAPGDCIAYRLSRKKCCFIHPKAFFCLLLYILYSFLISDSEFYLWIDYHSSL